MQKIDWDKPLEAVQKATGRVFPVTLSHKGYTPVQGQPAYYTRETPNAYETNNGWREDGTDHCSQDKWFIRNVRPAVPERYNVVRILSTMAETREQAEALARQNVEPGETIGIFKLIGTVERPAIPDPIVIYA